MTTIAVISDCGRYRITAALCDDGTRLDFWHWPFAGRAWVLTGGVELPDPLHVALDRAHELMRTNAGRLRQASPPALGMVE